MSAVEVVTLRLPLGMREDLQDIARSNKVSMNTQAVEVFRKAIRKRTPSKANLPTPGDK